MCPPLHKTVRRRYINNISRKRIEKGDIMNLKIFNSSLCLHERMTAAFQHASKTYISWVSALLQSLCSSQLSKPQLFQTFPTTSKTLSFFSPVGTISSESQSFFFTQLTPPHPFSVEILLPSGVFSDFLELVYSSKGILSENLPPVLRAMRNACVYQTENKFEERAIDH